MVLKTSLLGKVYEFKDIKDLLAKAGEEKSGDVLSGIAARSQAERVAAKIVLSDITLQAIRENPVVPYETDEVTRVIQDGIDEKQYDSIKSMTVGEFREFILREDGGGISRIRDGLTSEMIAAVTKLMSNLDLISSAKKLIVTTTCNTTIGKEGVFASRLQPNHPKDDIEGILSVVFEGLSYGIGDAVIGVNPAGNQIGQFKEIIQNLNEITEKYEIPTQNCVLAHIITQMEALKQGASVDLMFQSLAGSELSNRAFGINVSMLDEAYALMKERKHCKGDNFMYFETGQGSELSTDGSHQVDQVTMEARCHGLAKRYHPYIINTVVGFIGPEYLYNGRQTIRAGLEDHFMAKLAGLPMGVDCCHTSHMDQDQNDSELLALAVASAGCTFIMGIAGADDIMLMNQTTGFHDIAAVRTILDKKPIDEFNKRMEQLGILEDGKLTKYAGDPSVFFRR